MRPAASIIAGRFRPFVVAALVIVALVAQHPFAADAAHARGTHTKTIKAFKDATVWDGSVCCYMHTVYPDPTFKPKHCRECPCSNCTDGHDQVIQVNEFHVSSYALIGFNLVHKIPTSAKIQACTLILPNGSTDGDMNLGAFIAKHDWNEATVTAENFKSPGNVGFLTALAPLGQPNDVTEACKRWKKEKGQVNIRLSVIRPDMLQSYPSREAGHPAKLTVTYKAGRKGKKG